MPIGYSYGDDLPELQITDRDEMLWHLRLNLWGQENAWVEFSHFTAGAENRAKVHAEAVAYWQSRIDEHDAQQPEEAT